MKIWAGFDYMDKMGQFVVILECEGSYRMLRVRDIRHCTSASQILLLAYGYAIASLKEPCTIALQANAPTGLANIFDKRYPTKLIKPNIANARKKIDVKTRIVQGKHIVLKEGTKATREEIEEIILHKKLNMTGDKETFLKVYKSQMREELKEVQKKENRRKGNVKADT